jgi:uncharacterized protein involved in outer membrane biogenesis
MKVLKIFIVLLGVIFLFSIFMSFATFFIVKNVKIKDLVEREIEAELGISISIKALKYSPLLTSVVAEGVTIYNPDGFDENELAYLNSIRLVWDLGDLIFLKKPTIYLADVDLERLNIIKNKEGKVNIKELIPIKDPEKSTKDETPFSFNVLVLSIDKVSYIEYTAKGKKSHLYNIGMKNQFFVHLEDEDQVVTLIIHRAIQNTDIGKMVNLTINPILGGVSGTMDSAWGTAKTGAKSAWQIASLPFHLIFGK